MTFLLQHLQCILGSRKMHHESLWFLHEDKLRDDFSALEQKQDPSIFILDKVGEGYLEEIHALAKTKRDVLIVIPNVSLTSPEIKDVAQMTRISLYIPSPPIVHDVYGPCCILWLTESTTRGDRRFIFMDQKLCRRKIPRVKLGIIIDKKSNATTLDIKVRKTQKKKHNIKKNTET